jgi:4-amino-4-deoxy-L-arabinose transferase-like glycosyltransferase
MTERGGSWTPDAAWLSPPGNTETPRFGWLFLILVTLLAGLVRFFQLDHQSLWVDEIITWRSCRPGVGLEFWEQIGDNIQGPLFLAVLWPLVRIQSSEFLLRLPAAVAGILTIPLLAVAGRHIFGTRTGRLGALFLALSPFHLWYCQEARGYSFVILFATAASLVFWLMATRGPSPGKAISYALLSAFAVWSNMSALFVWAAHGITLVFLVRPRGRRVWALWIVAMAGGLAAGLPWLLKASGIWAIGRLVPGAATGDALRGETTLTPMAFPFAGFAFFFGYSLGPSLAELHQPDRLALVKQQLPLLLSAGGVGLVAVLAGLVSLRRLQWSLVLWIGVALLGLTLLAWRNIKPFNPRYLAVVFPWFLLLACYGLVNLPQRLAQVFTVALVGLFLWSVGQYHFSSHYAKADLRGAAQWVEAHQRPGEPVLVPVVTQVFEYYYQGRSQLLNSFNEGVLRTEEEVRDFFRRKLAGYESAWVVLARSWHLDPHDWLPKVLVGEGEILLEKRFTGTRLYHWRAGSAKGTADAG